MESVLAAVGVTSEKVERWIGAPCGCAERKERLNQISRWARQAGKLGISRANFFLKQLLESDNDA